MLRASPGREQQCGASSHPGGRCLEPKRTRRQKFRDQGGPSRDSLQRSQIVALLRRIPALHFDRELVSLRNHAELQQFVYRDCRGVARHDERCSEDELSGELPPDVMWPFSAVSELGEKGIFRVDWSVIPATADPFRGFGYKAPALTTRKILRREGGGHRCGGGHYDDTGEGEKDRLGRGARKRSQVESIATALKFLNLSPGKLCNLKLSLGIPLHEGMLYCKIPDLGCRVQVDPSSLKTPSRWIDNMFYVQSGCHALSRLTR